MTCLFIEIGKSTDICYNQRILAFYRDGFVERELFPSDDLVAGSLSVERNSNFPVRMCLHWIP